MDSLLGGYMNTKRHVQERFSFTSFFILLFFIALILGAKYLISTSRGAEIICRLAMNRCIPAELKSFESIDGNFLNGIAVNDVLIKNLRMIPGDITLAIPKLTVYFPSLDFKEGRVTSNLVWAQIFPVPHQGPIGRAKSIEHAAWVSRDDAVC